MEIEQAIAIVSQAKVNKITIVYNGGGDSGAIDEVLFGSVEESHDFPKEVVEAFRELGDRLLESNVNSEHDWWNNDGGQGEIHIAINDGKVKYDIEHQQNSTVDTIEKYESLLTPKDGILYEVADKLLTRHADSTVLEYLFQSEDYDDLQGPMASSLTKEQSEQIIERIQNMIQGWYGQAGFGDDHTEGTITFKRHGTEIKFNLQNHAFDKSTDDYEYNGTVNSGDDKND